MRCHGRPGFIGSNLAISLLDKGATVRVVDNLATGRKCNLEPYLSEIEFVKADIRNLEAVRAGIKKADYVFHQAAINSVPRSIDHPDLAVSSNVMGTLNLLMASREAGVKKFVYAISKYGAELLVRNYAQVFGLPTVSLRYFNVFGPRQDPYSHYAAVIPKFLNALLNKAAPTVFGDGTQARDFTYVENIVNGNILALKRGKPGEAYNIGCGGLVTLNELLDLLYEITGVRVKPVYKERRTGDVYRSSGEITRARTQLGYDPSVGLKEGLKKMTLWFMEKEMVEASPV